MSNNSLSRSISDKRIILNDVEYRLDVYFDLYWFYWHVRLKKINSPLYIGARFENKIGNLFFDDIENKECMEHLLKMSRAIELGEIKRRLNPIEIWKAIKDLFNLYFKKD